MTTKQRRAPNRTKAASKRSSLHVADTQHAVGTPQTRTANAHLALHIAQQIEPGRQSRAGSPVRFTHQNILQLQRTAGNRATSRLVHPSVAPSVAPVQREGGGGKGSVVDDKDKEPAGKLQDRTEEFRSSLGNLPQEDADAIEAIITAFSAYERSGRAPAQAKTVDALLKGFVTDHYADYGPAGPMPALMQWRMTVAREAGLIQEAGKAEESQGWAGAVWGALSAGASAVAGAAGWGARSVEVMAAQWLLGKLRSVGLNVHDDKNVVVDQLNQLGGSVLFGSPADLYVPYATVTKLGHQFALKGIRLEGLTFEWSVMQKKGTNLRISKIDIANATIRALKGPGSTEGEWSADVSGNIQLNNLYLRSITSLPKLLYSGLNTLAQRKTQAGTGAPSATLEGEVLTIGNVTATLSGMVALPGGLGRMGLGGAGGSTKLGVSQVEVRPDQAKWHAIASTAASVKSGGNAFDISNIDLDVNEVGDGRVRIALNLAAHMIAGLPDHVTKLLRKAPGLMLEITVKLKQYVPQPPETIAHGIEALGALAGPILDKLQRVASAAEEGLKAAGGEIKNVTSTTLDKAKSAVQDLQTRGEHIRQQMAMLKERAVSKARALEDALAKKSAAAAHKAVEKTTHGAAKVVEKTAPAARAVGHGLVKGAQSLASKSHGLLTPFKPAAKAFATGVEMAASTAETMADKGITLTAEVADKAIDKAINELRAAHDEVLRELKSMEDELSDLERQLASALEKQLASAAEHGAGVARQLAEKARIIELATASMTLAKEALSAAGEEIAAFLANPAAALAKHLDINRVYNIIKGSLPSAKWLKEELMKGGLGTDIYMQEPAIGPPGQDTERTSGK